eukprot:TRINITY_DN48339_c0_g1_i1.p1 TRINITY_DN48339_c0_g1~~TRINITY_DN48339_c0_g1_i1.p1  ORF type:complete len:179 (+),score=14.83 TRINITY_DN48339_c0_g1_i1:80-538(+)
MIYNVESVRFENFLTRRGVSSLAKFNTFTKNEMALRHLKSRTMALMQMRKTQSQLLKCSAFAKGNSKAIPSIYVYKPHHAFDSARGRNAPSRLIHHTNSHYHMAGSRQFQKGLRLKGVVMRHSRQAAVRNGKQGNASQRGNRGNGQPRALKN